MYINIRDIECFHYFENYSFLIDSTGDLIKLTTLQTKIVSAFFKENTVNTLILQLSIELDLTKITVQCYIDQIVETYHKYFYYSKIQDYSSNKVTISGKINQRFPFALTVSLTNFCGQNCKHCLSNASSKSQTELSYSNLENFLLHMNENINQICLTGGEPLLYSDIEKLIYTFKNKIKFSVVTSGYGVQKISLNLLKQLSTIQVSLHGGNAEMHDNYVQRAGAFNQVDKFIEKLQASQINFTAVTQAKCNDLEHLKCIIEYCIERKIKKLIIGELSPLGRAEKLPIWDSYNIELVEKNIAYLSKKYQSDITIIVDDETQRKSGNSTCFFSCGAGAYKWFINEKGHIYPCMLAQGEIYKIGSIYDQSYWHLINNTNKFNEYEKKWKEEACILYKYCENMGCLLIPFKQ